MSAKTVGSLIVRGNLQRRFLLPTEQISRSTSNYTIGFARLWREDNIEHAESVGSGSLVAVGGLNGILTAAHVTADVKKAKNVGLILRSENRGLFQRQVINMDHIAEPVQIGDAPFGPTGPDLSFIRLPDAGVGWLKARGSFYNLSKRRDDVLAGREPSPSYSDVVVGIVHEFTEEVRSENPRIKRLQFYALFGPARMRAVRYFVDRRLTFFEVQDKYPISDPFRTPTSYEGMSGGAVWRFYVAEKGDKAEVVEARLLGVPFFQNSLRDEKRMIVCHDAKDVYGLLIDAIRNRWPNEA